MIHSNPGQPNIIPLAQKKIAQQVGYLDSWWPGAESTRAETNPLFYSFDLITKDNQLRKMLIKITVNNFRVLENVSPVGIIK